jgi:hypothetical protein
MPPQQQPPQYPVINNQPTNHSQYDFIMGSPQAPRQRMPSRGVKPLVLIAAILTGLAVVLIVAFSLLSGGNDASKPLIVVVQQQQEIARVAGLQFSALSQQTTKNFAINTKLTMASDKSSFTKYLNKNGVDTPEKEIALGLHSTTDVKFTNAIATSTLDATVKAELQSELTSYRGSLRQAYASTTNQGTRALLQQYDKNADMLLTQSKE